jgi:hypothetical protein
LENNRCFFRVFPQREQVTHFPYDHHLKSVNPGPNSPIFRFSRRYPG